MKAWGVLFFLLTVGYLRAADKPFEIPFSAKDFLVQLTQKKKENLPFQYTANQEFTYDNLSKALKVFAIGDSLLQNFHTCSKLCMALQILRAKKQHAFIDTDPAPGTVQSLFEQLAEKRPTLALNIGVAGASVIKDPSEKDPAEFLKILSLKEQVTAILNMAIVPDLIYIWIGHNDVNLLASVGMRAEAVKKEFSRRFDDQLFRLVTSLKLKNPNQKKSIVVFALGNFQNVFSAREECARRRAENPKLYPEFDNAEKMFGVLAAAKQKAAIALSLELSQAMSESVARVSFYKDSMPNVQVRYSQALYNAPQFGCDELSLYDAYHPSVSGQQIIADVLYKEAVTSLEFLDD